MVERHDDGLSKTSPPRHFVHDSRGLSPKRQYDLWGELNSACAALPDPANPQDGFDFEVRAWHLGQGLLAQWSQSPQRLLRGKPRILADHRDQYVLMFSEEGSRAGDIEGNPIEIAPGRVCFVDLSRPFDFTRNPAASVGYVMPRGLLDEALPPGDRHGLILEGSVGRLLAEHLSSLKRHIGGLSEHHFAGVNRATRNLLTAALDRSEEGTAKAMPVVNAALLLRAKQHIEKRLDRGSIPIDGICRDLAVSRSQLYRLFKECGGVKAYANKRRLAKAKAALEGGIRGTIGEIAHRGGFSDEAYFSRSFRRTYGFSPSDCRRAAGHTLEIRPIASKPGHHPWASWIASLENDAP